MKRIEFSLGILLVMAFPAFSQLVEIPDTAFLYALINEGVDTDGDSAISIEEADTVTILHISEKGISDLAGIEYFLSLEQLDCSRNSIESLDISQNVHLTHLWASENQLSTLNLFYNPDIEVLDVSFNKFYSLYTAYCHSLTDLICHDNILRGLSFTENPALEFLDCSNNRLNYLKISEIRALGMLDCSNNSLVYLDVSKNSELISLKCSYNQLRGLDISCNRPIEELDISGNKLIHLDIVSNTHLSSLAIRDMPTLLEVCVRTIVFPPEELAIDATGSPNVIYTNECGLRDSIVFIPDGEFLFALIEEGVDLNGDSLVSTAEAESITYLDVSGEGIGNGFIRNMTGIEAFVNLDTLLCVYNQIESLNVSACSSLLVLSCDVNKITSLDISGCTHLKKLSCYSNIITHLNLSENLELEDLYCPANQLSRLDISNNSALTRIIAYDMPDLYEICVWDGFDQGSLDISLSGSPNAYFTTECLYDSIVFIPDTAFFNALIDRGADYNRDGLISYAEAEKVTFLDIRDRGITDMTGIEAFIALEELYCGINHLTSLDVSENRSLKILWCGDNNLADLRVSEDSSLEELNCQFNYLTSLDVSGNINLTTLVCAFNDITELDLTNNLKLDYLYFEENRLTSLDISRNTELTFLYCALNQITSLDVSKNVKLVELLCYDNQLTQLDVSKNLHLIDLTCYRNHLTSLDLTNNRALETLLIGYMPDLTEVCVWELPFPPSGIYVDTVESPNVYFSDCVAPVFAINNDSLYQPTYLSVLSSEKGMIFLVNTDTIQELGSLRSACLDSVSVNAGLPSLLDISGLGNGDYYVYAADRYGNVSEPIAFSINGVKTESQAADNIRIYPNPASSVLNIELDRSQPYTIHLNNLNVLRVFQAEIVGTTCKIDLSHFSKGVYFITIRSKDFVTTRKIVKL